MNNDDLLRPFNLELAKQGEEICWSHLDCPVTFIGVSQAGKIAFESENELGFISSSSFRMKPLTWIDGIPVYKGDVLWYRGQQFCIEVQGYNPTCEDGLIGIVVKSQTELISVGEQTSAPFYQWQWDKPKQVVKRKVWINVYSDYFYSYFSKEEADTLAGKGRITCVEREIEYEV